LSEFLIYEIGSLLFEGSKATSSLARTISTKLRNSGFAQSLGLGKEHGKSAII